MKHYEVLNGSGDIGKFDETFTETFDFREGCLLDNYIGIRENGNAALVFEKYQNCWCSKYEVYETETDSEYNELWEIWEAFRDSYDLENEGE